MAECVTCTAKAGTAYVCTRCANRTAADLRRLASLIGDLETTITRQSRAGDGGPATDRHPLPVDLGAAARADTIRTTVTTWARHILATRGITVTRVPRIVGPTCPTTAGSPTCGHPSCATIIRTAQPRNVLGATTRWLASQCEWLRHQPEAAQALAELTAAARLADRVIDRRTPQLYAGPCRADLEEGGICQADLYAQPGADTIRCRDCRATHSAAARREWLLAEAQDVLAWAELAAQALAALGLPCTRAQVAGWAHRGRLSEHGRDRAGRVLYRVGDVITLAEQAALAKTDRAAA